MCCRDSGGITRLYIDEVNTQLAVLKLLRLNITSLQCSHEYPWVAECRQAAPTQNCVDQDQESAVDCSATTVRVLVRGSGLVTLWK